jgi:molybdenum cofactor synthesis domain-containing protein
MGGFLEVVELGEMRRALEGLWRPVPRTCEVNLQGALGLTAALDIKAPIDLPPFNRAAYDGYAVLARDTFGADEEKPVRLKLRGVISPGVSPRLGVKAGTCARISTGAKMPPGADAVVMREYCAEVKNEVLVRRAVAPGENVTKRGSDIRKGEVLVRAGTKLMPAHIGALSAAGISRVRVLGKPRVAIISTGDELVSPGMPLSPGKVYDANGPALMSAVLECGGIPVYLGICRDDAGAIRSKIREGLKSCDILLISGGTSAGAGDIIPDVVGGMRGARIVAHGLAHKPGKPALAAVVNGKPVFGLPGCPVSALVMFERIVAEYICRLSGSPISPGRTVRAVLGSKVISATGRTELVPVRLVEEGEGLIAYPIQKDSGAIASLSMADGFVEIPKEREILEKGEVVEVRVFRGR